MKALKVEIIYNFLSVTVYLWEVLFARTCKFVTLLGRLLSDMILDPFGVVNSTIMGTLSEVFDSILITSLTVLS